MDVFHLIAFGLIVVCLGVAAMVSWLMPKPNGPIDTSGAH